MTGDNIMIHFLYFFRMIMRRTVNSALSYEKKDTYSKWTL